MRKKYILVITAFLLCLAFILTGCNRTYQAGNFSHKYIYNAPMIGVKANTNKFFVNNVTFDLYIGLYESSRKQQYNPWGDKKVVYVIYACEENTHHLYEVNDVVSDYTKLDKLFYIKHIDEEQALKEEYGFTTNREDGVVYTHRELITVPEKVFDSQNNSFSIRIVTYVHNESIGGYRIVDRYNGIYLGYKFINKHQVKIDFSPEGY